MDGNALNDTRLANAQVAHLFLRAAAEKVIGATTAESAMRSLFPDLFDPQEQQTTIFEPHGLVKAITELLQAMERDAAAPSYSGNVRSARDTLRVLVQAV